MYIKNRYADLVSKVFITVLSVVGLWVMFASFGGQAWRLLDTWFLIVSIVYYAGIAVYYFAKPDRQGQVVCPMLQGSLVVIGVVLLVSRIVGAAGALEIIGLEGFACFLVNFLLPVVTFLDWLIFTKKGRIRVVDPWYWLALTLVYAGIIILTARNAGEFAYPYEFLNYAKIGIDTMIWWVVLVCVVILIIGYCLVILDFVLSGELGRHIVMPKIKTIVIEEEIEVAEGDKEVDDIKEDTEVETKKVEDSKRPEKVVSESTKNNDNTGKPNPKVQSQSQAQKKSEISKKTSVPVTKVGTKASKTDNPKVNEPATSEKGAKVIKVVKNTQVKVEGLKDNKSAKNMHGAKISSRTSQRPRRSKSAKNLPKKNNSQKDLKKN